MRRIKVIYEDDIKEGNIMYQTGGCNDTDMLGYVYGVIFDDGSTDTITDFNNYTLL